MTMRRRGFTLIELLIALAIFVFLILLAGPMYADFMGNSQIRNAAENALTGVRYAQTTAIKTNRPVKFVLNPAATTGGWAVYEFDENAGDYFGGASQAYRWIDGALRTTVTPVPADATQVTFNGLGRVMPNADASTSLTEIDVTNTNISAASRRPLKIIIGAVNSGTKLCDPAVSAPDARACP
jgi:prepilin-type N-terminal cleavage/methylation domain-containing protein